MSTPSTRMLLPAGKATRAMATLSSACRRMTEFSAVGAPWMFNKFAIRVAASILLSGERSYGVQHGNPATGVVPGGDGHGLRDSCGGACLFVAGGRQHAA